MELRKSNQKSDSCVSMRAFVGNAAAQDMVEGGDAVACDEEKLIVRT